MFTPLQWQQEQWQQQWTLTGGWAAAVWQQWQQCATVPRTQGWSQGVFLLSLCVRVSVARALLCVDHNVPAVSAFVWLSLNRLVAVTASWHLESWGI